MERGGLAVALQKRVSSLNHDKYMILRRDLEAWVINMCCASSLCGRNVLFKLPKKGDHVLVLDRHFANSNLAYVSPPGVGGKAI